MFLAYVTSAGFSWENLWAIDRQLLDSNRVCQVGKSSESHRMGECVEDLVD